MFTDVKHMRPQSPSLQTGNAMICAGFSATAIYAPATVKATAAELG
jgi:hypothetical protein